jgi:hypothetical protein
MRCSERRSLVPADLTCWSQRTPSNLVQSRPSGQGRSCGPRFTLNLGLCEDGHGHGTVRHDAIRPAKACTPMVRVPALRCKQETPHRWNGRGRATTEECGYVPESTCSVIQLPANRVCGDAAVVEIVVGCRHEHIKQRYACQWDADNLLSGDDEIGFCADCDALGHRCSFTGKVIRLLSNVT